MKSLQSLLTLMCVVTLGACSANNPPAESAKEASEQAANNSKAADVAQPQPTDEQTENTTAILSIAKLLADERGSDPVALAQFCEQNAKALASPEGISRCKAQSRSQAAHVPIPSNKEEAFLTAATLDGRSRFEFCTSRHVMSMFTQSPDYDNCFPPAARKEAMAAGATLSDESEEELPVETSPMAMREHVLLNATRMNDMERQVYCNVEMVREALNNEIGECLVGLSPFNPVGKPLTDTDPGYQDQD